MALSSPPALVSTLGSGLVSVRKKIKMYTVYVIKSQKDKKLYYGFTNDINRRLREHNNGEVLSTKSRIPFSLVYSELADTVQSARKKERYFKSGFGRKHIKNKILALSSNG